MTPIKRTHTPATWRVTVHPDFFGTYVVEPFASRHEQSDGTEWDALSEEDTANGWLIAAAPDMLAALEACIRVLADHASSPGDAGQAYRMAVEAAAFAKAEVLGRPS